MKKGYKSPEMKIFEISVEDIIQTSGIPGAPGLNNGGQGGSIGNEEGDDNIF